MTKKTILLLLTLSSFAFALPGEGRLGVFLQRLDPDLAESLKYRGEGVVVQKVMEDGGADRAGIEVGDIIVSVNGKKVLGSQDVLQALGNSAPGEEAKVHVLRKGEPLDFVVALSGPEIFPVQKNKWVVIREESPWLGIEMVAMSDQLSAFFKVEGGLLVNSVAPDSPAAKAGIQAGDIIVGASDQAVRKNEDLLRELRQHKAGDSLSLEIVRNGKTQSFKAELMKREGHADSHSFEYFYGDPNTIEKFDIPQWHWRPDADLQKQLDDLKKELDELRKELKKN